MSAEPDGRRRHEENIRLGRDLARRLADEAQAIAATLENLAGMHEQLAELTDHPLSRGARERAAAERLLAGRERVASRWFLAISDGSYRPAARAQREPLQ